VESFIDCADDRDSSSCPYEKGRVPVEAPKLINKCLDAIDANLV
jgi:hypothetical protein